jgi:porin
LTKTAGISKGGKSMSKKILSLIFLLTVSFFSIPVSAGTDVINFWENDHLLGDWGGKRSSLEENGLFFELVYTGEVLRLISGGIKRETNYEANIDLTMTLDTALADLWKGGTFFVYFLNNHGEKQPSSDFIGDLQTVSNIEAPTATRLYELWYEQQLLDNTFSILIGQYDLNYEFAFTEYGSLFINSSFGIQPDISANVPVSIFPVTAPAVRLKWAPIETLYLMVAAYEGDPGDPAINKHGTRWKLFSREGTMTIFEAGYRIGLEKGGALIPPGTYKLGVWYHTADFDDVTATDVAGDPIQHDGNYGVYVIADQMVYRERGHQGLGVFTQIGGAPDDRNEIDFYLGAGINYYGLIPGRDEDIVGIAGAYASISDNLRSAEPRDAAETTVEVTYLAQIMPWFAIQPDFQYIHNTGADPELDDAVVALLRFEINF